MSLSYAPSRYFDTPGSTTSARPYPTARVGLRAAQLAGALLLGAAVAPATADAASPTESSEAASFVIDNVRIEVGDGTVIEQGSVVVRDGRIAEVGERVTAPEGVSRIDAAGKVLTPGLIESRAQIGLVEVPMAKETRDAAMSGALTPAFRALDGFNFNSTRIAVNRREGVTGAVIAPSSGLLAGSAGFVELFTGPRAVGTARQPIALFGAVDSDASRMAGGARGGIWLRLRRVFDDTRLYLDNRRAYERGKMPELALPAAHLQALAPLLERQIPLVLEAHRASDIRQAVRFAKREEVRLIIAGATEAWMVASHLADADVPVILKPTEQVPWGFEALGARDDSAAILHSQGVTVALSAGGWSQNIRRLRQQAGIAVAHGLEHHAAVQAITQSPATMFGLDEKIGSIAEGKRANLVLWSGDPLEVRTRVDTIWIGGQRQSLSSRQEQLVERYLDRADAAPTRQQQAE